MRQSTAAATVLKMAYGYEVEPKGSDPLIDTIEQMMREFSLAAVPMTWAPDILPILRHLPDGFPGVTFQATAKRWRKTIEESACIPYRFVRQQMAKKEHRSSYVSKLVEQMEAESQDGKLTSVDEEAIVWTAASLYGAAADTTVISLTAFALAMLKYPSVQENAQREIDTVVGPDRLPTFDDRSRLPYVDALIKEVSRWWPIAPMSFPHTATEAFEFNGYTIPKGAFLLPAVYWFMRDPVMYPNPQAFDPDRFLEPRNEPDPVSEVFGYGRRICPGRFFADSALYINILQTLACFRIRKALDGDGNEIGVEHVKPQPGILTYPTHFELRIQVRSEAFARLIQEIEKRTPQGTGDSELLQGLS